ncbi:hypothetical protein HGA34_02560 [Candidatus Falkowbacteria bacterium]|nr:hypothetical protein [Candidatus Falkowbacteria bacterium]
MKIFAKIFACLLLASAISGHGVRTVSAQTMDSAVTVTPSIVDERAEAKEIIEKTVKLKNNTAAKVELYPTVNDVKQDEGRQEFVDPSKLDRATSLARWIEIRRGVVELGPNQEVEVPLKITVNMNAQPGKYFAAITFPNGSNRAAAEQLANQPQMMISIEVTEHVVEKAENFAFSTEKQVNLNNQVKFLIGLKNIGNKDIYPKGSIIIYDRREREVESIDVNYNQQLVKPGENPQFEPVWSAGKRMGKFKAKLEVEYGKSGDRNIQDTIYFWIMPWWLLAMICLLFLLLVTSVWLFYSRIKHHSRVIQTAQEEAKSPIINLKNRPRH